jgi:hypothetical protein
MNLDLDWGVHYSIKARITRGSLCAPGNLDDRNGVDYVCYILIDSFFIPTEFDSADFP